MQAGLTRQRLTLREIFSSRMVFRASKCPIRALRLGPVRQGSCLANGSGSLTTFDDGSTFCAVYVSFAGDGPVKNIVDLALSLPGKVCQGFFFARQKKTPAQAVPIQGLPKQALYSAPPTRKGTEQSGRCILKFFPG